MSKLIPDQTEILAGLEMGGIPIATTLSQLSNIPTIFVRKIAKKYGTSNLAEGCGVKGKNVLIIEDIVTSGGQIILSAKKLRKLGANIQNVLCVIDREEGATKNLTKENLELISLFKMSELKSSSNK